jgi:hypothetical protein
MNFCATHITVYYTLVFWVVTPYSLKGGYQHFKGIYCLLQHVAGYELDNQRFRFPSPVKAEMFLFIISLGQPYLVGAGGYFPGGLSSQDVKPTPHSY